MGVKTSEETKEAQNNIWNEMARWAECLHLAEFVEILGLLSEDIARVSNAWQVQFLLWQPAFWNTYFLLFMEGKSIREEFRAAGRAISGCFGGDHHSRRNFARAARPAPPTPPTVLTLEKLADAIEGLFLLAVRLWATHFIILLGLLGEGDGQLGVKATWAYFMISYGYGRLIIRRKRHNALADEMKNISVRPAGMSETEENAHEDQQEDPQGGQQ